MTLKYLKKTRKNKKPRKNKKNKTKYKNKKNKKITQNKKKLYKKNLVGGVDNIEWNKGQYSVMEQWIEHKRQIAEQERQIAEQERQIAEQERQIAEQKRKIAEQKQIAEQEQKIVEQARQIAEQQRQPEITATQEKIIKQWIEHKRQIEEQKHIEPQDKAHQDAILRQTQELLSEQTIKKRKTPISKRNKPVISEKLINDAIKELVIENEVDNLKFTDNELKKLEKLLNQKDSTR